MEAARGMIRRASRRLRRRSSRTSRQYEDTVSTTSEVQDVAGTASACDKEVSTQDSKPIALAAAPAASEAAAIAAKLSDSDSSLELENLGAAQAAVDHVEKLFLQQRRELRNELQAIQDSQRPVTKGDQRRLLDRFLRYHLHGEEPASDTSSLGSNEGVASPRRRRNGMVVQELEGLSQQQSVTQRLRCPRFRRDLENMVRGAVIRQEQEVETALRLRNAGLPGNRRNPLVAVDVGRMETGSHVSGVSSVSSAQSFLSAADQQNGGIPAAPPLPPLPGEYQAPPPPPPFQPPQPQAAPRQPQAAPRQPQAAPRQPQAPPQEQGGSSRWPLPTAPWLVQNSGRPAPGQAGSDRAQVLQQVHREAIVSEISELVHRQLVQETLAGEFRGRLEWLMESRLERTEADGQGVMNYVRSIPQSQHIRRNDFSHLGIHVHREEPERAMAAGGAVPGEFMNQMQSLQSRMNELQEMVRMSMEMQLDLQRAIRQEVAAALNHQHGPVDSSAQQPASQPASEGNCIICLDKEVDAVLYQCGHMCVCLTCGMRLSAMGSHCPMCRAPIRDVIRAYRSQRT